MRSKNDSLLDKIKEGLKTKLERMIEEHAKERRALEAKNKIEESKATLIIQ